MNLIEIIDQANTIADEDLDTDVVVGFLNDAVARINVECEANFPYFSMQDTDSEYPGFPEKWQRTLLVPFVVGRIKQTDSSQFEYNDSYSEFVSNILQFKAMFRIPEEYKDTLARSVWTQDDMANSPWGW